MGPRSSPAGPGTRCRRPPPPSGPQLRHPEIPARKCRPVTPATAPAPERSLPFPATGRSRLLRPPREVAGSSPAGRRERGVPNGVGRRETCGAWQRGVQGGVGCSVARGAGTWGVRAVWGAGTWGRGVAWGAGQCGVPAAWGAGAWGGQPGGDWGTRHKVPIQGHPAAAAVPGPRECHPRGVQISSSKPLNSRGHEGWPWAHEEV